MVAFRTLIAAILAAEVYCEIGKRQIVASQARVIAPTDFVGFSYSRASMNPPSKRFIHFLTEVGNKVVLFLLL